MKKMPKMIDVLKYKDLSDSKEVMKIPSGVTLEEFIPDVNWNNFAIIANGKTVSKDYVLKENDIVVIRAIPHSTGILIATIAIAVIAGVAAGVAMYKQNKLAAKMKKQLEELESSTQSDVVNNPCIAGASNGVATGKTQPYLIGTHLFTPYILNASGSGSSGYHTINGTNGRQCYYNVVLENGFNKQIVNAIYADSVKVMSLGGTAPQGTDGADSIYHFAANSSFADTESFVEIRQDGKDFATESFNKKIVENETSDQLKKHPASESDDGGEDDDYEDLFYTLEENSMGVDVCIMFNGLLHYNSSGTMGEKTRNIIPSYSLDYAQLVAEGNSDPVNNATWKEFSFNQLVHHDDEIATESASYKYTVMNKWVTHDSDVYDNINDWVQTSSGTDLRSSYTNVSYTFKRYWENRVPRIDYYITLERTYVKTAAYDEEYLSNTFTRKVSSQIRFNAHADFAFDDIYSDGEKKYSFPVTVRMTCPDRKIESGTDVDDCYIQWIHSYIYDEKKSVSAGSFVAERIIAEREAKLSSLIGIRILSTSSNEDALGKISVLSSGLARTWNGTQWSDGKTATSNIASWILEILTSPIHSPSQLDDSEIDMDSFGAFYEYCETNGLYVNKVLTSGATKENVLSEILSIGRAVLYQNIYGLVSVAFDTLQENICGLLNEQNIISLSFEKELVRQPDGVKLTYTDANNGYQENTLIEMYDGSDADERSADSTITELSASGITTQIEAWQYMHYVMNSARLRPRKITVSVGKEGLFAVPYSKILLQHSALKLGLGNAEIKSVISDGEAITGLELYDALEMVSGESYYVQIQCVGSDSAGVVTRQIKTEEGRPTEIEFAQSISLSASLIPHAGDILTYGNELTTISEEFVISEITPSTDGYSLTLYDYDERIFDFGDVPEYESVLSNSATVSSYELPDTVPDNPYANKGVGVESIKNYYLASDKKTGVDHDTEGWSESNGGASAEYPYLWTYSEITYTDGTTGQTECTILVTWEDYADDLAEAVQGVSDVMQHGVTFTNVKAVSSIIDVGTLPSVDSLQAEIDDIRKEAADSLSATSDSWTIELESSETETRAEIKATADKIYTKVESLDESLSTQILQNRESITAQATSISDLSRSVAQLKVDSEGITQTVQTITETTVPALESSIGTAQSTADTANDKLDNENTSSKLKTTLISQIKTTADSITATVAEQIKNLDTETTETIESQIQMLSNQITAMVDNDTRNTNASISIAYDDILLQVENVEKGLKASLEIQESAITALVEGAGTSGQMSLSLQLPVLIDEATRAKMVSAKNSEGESISSETLVESVYTEYATGEGVYAIKSTATDDNIRKLWEVCVEGGLLASQIDLIADQMNIQASNIVVKTDNIFTVEGKLKADYIDVDNLFAQTIEIPSGGIIESSNWFLNKSGFYINGSGAAKFSQLELGADCIIGGSLRSNTYTANTTGYKLNSDGSAEFNGATISGNYEKGVSGWKITSDGDAEFNSGTFNGTVNATSGSFTDLQVAGDAKVTGTLQSSNWSFDTSTKKWSGWRLPSQTSSGDISLFQRFACDYIMAKSLSNPYGFQSVTNPYLQGYPITQRSLKTTEGWYPCIAGMGYRGINYTGIYALLNVAGVLNVNSIEDISCLCNGKLVDSTYYYSVNEIYKIGWLSAPANIYTSKNAVYIVARVDYNDDDDDGWTENCLLICNEGSNTWNAYSFTGTALDVSLNFTDESIIMI